MYVCMVSVGMYGNDVVLIGLVRNFIFVLVFGSLSEGEDGFVFIRSCLFFILVYLVDSG